MRRAGARENEIDRLDGHDPIAIESVEVEHENVGRRADAQRSVARRAVGESAVGDDLRQPLAALDDAVEAPAAMQEMTEPHFPHDVVVLVEGRRVDAQRDAAAAPDRFGDRRDAASQVKIRARVGGDDRARGRDGVELFGAAIDAMGQRQPRRQQPERA